jgi:hypothetical protein
MSAVTQLTSPYRHVIGDLVCRFYSLTITNGQTLDTGMVNIQGVFIQPATSNSITNVAISGGTITFTGTGTALTVMVIARVG